MALQNYFLRRMISLLLYNLLEIEKSASGKPVYIYQMMVMRTLEKVMKKIVHLILIIKMIVKVRIFYGYRLVMIYVVYVMVIIALV